MSKTTTKSAEATTPATAKGTAKPKATSKATKPAAANRTAKETKVPRKREGKLSALDAAAQVLAKAKEPLGAKALIEAMAAQGLWTSPGGQTPHATLYAAIIREIATRGAEARFQKVDRGQFTLADSGATQPPAKTKAKPAPMATGKGAGTKQPADGTPGPKAVSELFQV